MFPGVASFLDIPLGCIFNGGAPNSSPTSHGNLGWKGTPLVFSVRPWFRENLTTLSAHFYHSWIRLYEWQKWSTDGNVPRMLSRTHKMEKGQIDRKAGLDIMRPTVLAQTCLYHSIHLWNSSRCQWPQKVGTVLSHQNLNDDSDGCNRVIRLSVFPSLCGNIPMILYHLCMSYVGKGYLCFGTSVKGNPYEPTAIQTTTNDTLAKLCRLALLFDGFCWPVISWRQLDVVVSGMVLWGIRFGFVEFADAAKSTPCLGHALEEMQ